MPPPDDHSPDADPVARLQGLLGGPGRRRGGPAPAAWADVLRGRWSLPVTAGLAALVLVAVVAALLALRAVTTAPVEPAASATGPAPAAASVPTSAPAAAPAAAGPSATGAGTAAAAGTAAPEVVVDVEGHVTTPGLVRLPQGSRVDDAVRAAGGPAEPADLARLNLARPLVDGEQVLVPAPGDPAPAPAAGPVTGGGRAGAGATAPAGPVALGTATLADLDALPGVGPVLAQRIVDWRTQHGGFSSVDELGEVSGIGDVLLERLRPLVVV